ncbi:uncharacterized protein [Phaseolus vulgaris]|uniref:uncharacterized protein n=1 Tax=Phaseolus vulgaris TaxID=3885 RepID=UPI0035CA8D37
MSRGGKRSHRSLSQETLRTPRISTYPVLGEELLQVFLVEGGETWMMPYKRYLADGIFPLEPTEARKINKNSTKYILIDGELFRHKFTHPILVCVNDKKCARIMAELHEGICESHIGGRSLALKVIRVGYYWPTISEDCTRHAQQCKQCQQHAFCTDLSVRVQTVAKAPFVFAGERFFNPRKFDSQAVTEEQYEIVKTSREINNGSQIKKGFAKFGGRWVSKDGDQAGSSSGAHIGEDNEGEVVATGNEPIGAHEAGPSDVNMEE